MKILKYILDVTETFTFNIKHTKNLHKNLTTIRASTKNNIVFRTKLLLQKSHEAVPLRYYEFTC
jgi:hypothetical protein